MVIASELEKCKRIYSRNLSKSFFIMIIYIVFITLLIYYYW